MFCFFFLHVTHVPNSHFFSQLFLPLKKRKRKKENQAENETVDTMGAGLELSTSQLLHVSVSDRRGRVKERDAFQVSRYLFVVLE